MVAAAVKICISFNVTPCSPVDVSRRFGRTCHLNLQCTTVKSTCCLLRVGQLLAYSSNMKIEAICSSEMSLDFDVITWRYIQGNIILVKNTDDNNSIVSSVAYFCNLMRTQRSTRWK
jgi:hypothetical protein